MADALLYKRAQELIGMRIIHINPKRYDIYAFLIYFTLQKTNCMSKALALLLLFLFLQYSSPAQLPFDERARVDSLGLIINSSNLSAQKILDSITHAITTDRDPLTDNQFKYLEELLIDKFGSSLSLDDQYILAFFEMNWYIKNGQIGKALAAVDKYYQLVKNSTDKKMLGKAYALYGGLYSRFGMQPERVKYAQMDFHLRYKDADAAERANLESAYGWVLTQAGWELKNKTYLDSAAILLKNTLTYSLAHNEDYGAVNEHYGVYLMTLTRQKNYAELLSVAREAYNYEQTNPLINPTARKSYSASFISRIGLAYMGLNKRDSAFYYLDMPVRFTDEKSAGTTFYPENKMYYNAEKMMDIVSTHVHFNEYKEAAALLDIALFSADRFTVPDIFSYLYETAAPIYEKAGMPDHALICYREGKKLNDSLQRENEKTQKEADSISAVLQIEAVAVASKLEKQKIEWQSKAKTYSLGGCILIVLLVAFSIYRSSKLKQKANTLLEERNRTITDERNRSDELLLNILPEEIAKELKEKGSSDAKLIDDVTVLFTDFKDFTQLSEKLSPKALVGEINECFSAFDSIMQKHNVEKIKTIGDSYMAAGGLPTANKTHPEDVVTAALEIQQFMVAHKAKKEAANEPVFEIRIGVHTGPVVAGIVGVKKFQYDIWGDTVNTASRMESSGEVGQVNVSETTYELVKDKFNCFYRGEIEAKGKGKLKMYYVRAT
jgi:class 3 adenylate cyclase